MNFSTPLGFLGLLSCVVIIFIYLLKQEYEQKPVSHLFLWQRTALSMAMKPWQKYKKEFLMVLQLLAAILITVALAGPFITGNREAENYIFMLDASYGMQAVDESPNRFYKSKQDLIQIIENAAPDSYFSLIVGDKNPYTAIHLSQDKTSVINKINSLEVTNEDLNRESFKNLAINLQQAQGGTIYQFSYGLVDLDPLIVNFIASGGQRNNLAITNLSHAVDSDEIVSLVKVVNFGDSAARNAVALYADDVLFDIIEFELKPMEERDLFFTSIPYGSKRLQAHLMDEDILAIDNDYYDIVRYGRKEQGVLFTKQNIFLEHMLDLLPDLEVFIGEEEAINILSGYYLYIYDGIMPEQLPEDGHILIFNPPQENSLIEISGQTETETIYADESAILNFIWDLDFSIAKSQIMEIPDWASAVISSEKTPLVLVGEKEGQKIVVAGFDLHDTDLPLKKEFPIFMYNLKQYFMPENILSSAKLYTGEGTEFDLYPDALLAKVVTPAGKTSQIAPPFPALLYGETEEPGFYLLVQEFEDRQLSTDFAVNINTAEGSDFTAVQSLTETDSLSSKVVFKNVYLKNAFLFGALIIVCLEWLVRHHFRFYCPDMLRIITILLICLSLFDLDIKREAKETYTIFAVDLSASVGADKNKALALINESVDSAGTEDHVGIVAFGKNAVVEMQPGNVYSSIALDSFLDKDFTNIAEGLSLSRSLFPDQVNKRVALLSDGLETVGDAATEAKAFKEQDIVLDVFYLNQLYEDEVQLTKLNVPKNVNQNTGYQIEIKAHSISENEGRILLYRNDILIGDMDVFLKKGENRFVFSDFSNEGGHMIYRAEIQPLKDTVYENNKVYAYSYIEDAGSVLVISRDGSGAEIYKILDQSLLSAAMAEPHNAPLTLAEINRYDAVVMADISLDDLPEEWPDLINAYVKNGGGLLVGGGEHSYGLGGYYETPLEEVLPVNMTLVDDGNIPNLGIVMVIDRSGSMSSGQYGISKMELAKESVIRSIDTLRPKDMVGVIAFDNEPTWISEMSEVGNNKTAIKDQMASISVGGGTSILPALEEAFIELEKADTKLKHIILLTDGQAEKDGYDTLLDQMGQKGITLSTVAVGNESDVTLLESLAAKASGRYYYTDVFMDLPKIFTNETFLAGKNYLNHEDFYPVVGQKSVILEEIDTLPLFHGYIASSLKPRADGVLLGPDDAPIVAGWQYGLGRSVAFLSDLGGQWTEELLNSDEGMKLIRNMVSYTIGTQSKSGITAIGAVTGSESEITVMIPYASGITKVSGTFFSEDLTETEILLKSSEPGIYKGIVPFAEEGAYGANIFVERNGVTESYVTGIHLPYAKEYDITNKNSGEEFLNNLVQITGGRVLTDLNQVFEPMAVRVLASTNISSYIILILLLWLLFDIVYHRFPIFRNFSFTWISVKKSLKTAELKIDMINKSPIVDESVSAKETHDIVPGNGKDGWQEEIKPNSHEKPDQNKSTSSKLLSNKKKRTGR